MKEPLLTCASCQNSEAAMFQDMGSSPATMEASKFCDMYSLLTGNGQAFWDAFVHLVAPTIVLAVGPLAQITSMIRSSMLDELGKPYVAYSSAVGMPRFLIDYKYALRNAFSSTLTLIGFLFPLMIGGAFVVEKVFAGSTTGGLRRRRVTGEIR